MTTNEIRLRFLNFFKSKGHSIIKSDSLVPHDDPTVLFTTAGMQQFKPQFMGHIDGFTRASTAQKCLRTDDLDCVGKTDFHHTFFEMLGNFSFGDYFKKEAIHWAWEFLTVDLQLPCAKLWVSVYKEDEEAYHIWLNDIKMPLERIVKLGDKSNFWPSNARLNGPNGPCGPCSEIFYDYGVNANCPQGKSCDPDCSCGRFSEVWNLVFTQYNRKEGGILEPLPAKNIDTGMGLERLAAVVQGKKSNYETDNWAAILKVIKETFRSNNAQLTEREYRIIADHMRAVTFGIADGVVPSNEGRGYVMRKLIVDMTDLAIRAGIEKPVVHTFVDVVIERMKGPYPELVSKIEDIKSLIKRIEEAFMKVRILRVPELKDKLSVALNNIQELGAIFFLYRDTHGLTLSTITTVAQEVGIRKEKIAAAVKIFETMMDEQKNRSRASSKMMGDVFADQDFSLNVPKTIFLGYETTKASAKVLKVFNQDGVVKVILDRTPFYAESGGQVGDCGYMTSSTARIRIEATQKTNDIFVHLGRIEQGVINEGDEIQALIDEPRRQAIARNHSATHLLQSALRDILGAHVKQQGSLVDENRLRFDFAHHKSVSQDEIQRIEAIMNGFIKNGDSVKKEVLPIEEAKKKGALAFFAEKYGDVVRVISMGNYSTEFCGGTHVANTADIEAIKIISEGSVAQGIRRVEAITGRRDVDAFLKDIQEKQHAQKQMEEQRILEKRQQGQKFEELKSKLPELLQTVKMINGVNVLIHEFDNIDIASLRKLSDIITRQPLLSLIIIFTLRSATDATIFVSATDDMVKQGFDANAAIKQINPIFDGSGGGRANMAQAGSKNPGKLSAALISLKDIIKIKI